MNSLSTYSKSLKEEWQKRINSMIEALEDTLATFGESLTEQQLEEYREIKADIASLENQLYEIVGRNEEDYQMYCWNMDRRA